VQSKTVKVVVKDLLTADNQPKKKTPSNTLKILSPTHSATNLQ